MKTRFEEVSEDDIETIAAIEKDSFIDPWTESMFLNAMKYDYFHFNKLTNENQIIGFISYYIIQGVEAHIASIAIKQEYRGCGFSKILFKHFLNDCAKKCVESATLEVRKSNRIAINLYESIGFKNYGIRPKYYQDGEDAVIMWLDIKH